MKSKKTNRIWTISLILVGIATILLAGSKVMGMKLPDIMVRGIGVLDLIALVVLIFLTAGKMVKRD